MLDDAAIVAHPRMVALRQAHARATAQHEEWVRHREDALAAELREADHFATEHHHPTGGHDGTCGVCGKQVHPVNA